MKLEVFDAPRFTLVVHTQLQHMWRTRASGFAWPVCFEMLQEVAVPAYHATNINLGVRLLAWGWPRKLPICHAMLDTTSDISQRRIALFIAAWYREQHVLRCTRYDTLGVTEPAIVNHQNLDELLIGHKPEECADHAREPCDLFTSGQSQACNSNYVAYIFGNPNTHTISSVVAEDVMVDVLEICIDRTSWGRQALQIMPQPVLLDPYHRT